LTGKDRQKHLMLEALAEAVRGRGRTFPNPAVGAVVARGRRIVGRGFHKRWGRPHAEVEALKDAGPRSKGADLYVTLEPCSHTGRTPPCTDAIIGSGIRRVIVPGMDPNPLVRGRGLGALRRAGLDVVVGPCAREARKINEAYFHFMRTGRPFVTLKTAQTLDGRIATRRGESRWVTSSPSRKLGRRMRAEAQAIVVGVNTVRNDDPELLPVPRRDTYYRCILDTRLSIPLGSKVIKTATRHPTIVYYADAPRARVSRLEARGVRARKISKDGSLVSLEAAVADLGSLGVMHALVEGGGKVASSFLRAGLVDKLVAFTAPKVLGDVNGLGAFSDLRIKDLDASIKFRIDEVSRVGHDVLMTLYPDRRRGGS
jgi:diaminohydroxyphosphoribosylaminopyrimidine deaminase/5-amino-6-(5-phosphoribosylamino)uracil reductase